MNDNNKMLERVLLMMKYDSSKTLTENSDVVRNEFSKQLNEARGDGLRATAKAAKDAEIAFAKAAANASKKAANVTKNTVKNVNNINVNVGGLTKGGLSQDQIAKEAAIFQKSLRAGKKGAPTAAEKAQVKQYIDDLASGKIKPTVSTPAPLPAGGAKPSAKPSAKPKPKPSPKDAGILSKFVGSVKKYPYKYAFGLGLTGLGVWYFLRDNTEVSPCLLDSLTEEEMAALNGAGTSGTITRAQVGNRLADLNGGLIFSLDKPDVVTANGKYKGTYSCDGGALKISIAGSEFMLGAGTPSADTGTNGGGGTSGGGGGGRYTQCPETLPIAMYCKNSTVARVQGCVGAKQDGAFGPNTSAALVAKGADGSSITQASIDKVCGPGVAAKIEKLGQDVDVEDMGGNTTSNNVNIKSSDNSEDGIGG